MITCRSESTKKIKFTSLNIEMDLKCKKTTLILNKEEIMNEMVSLPWTMRTW